MEYGYCRCSTNENKQDIDRQIRELITLNVKKDNIFFEYASGIKDDRVELNRLLSTVKAGDTIIATEVSRITRSTKQLCEIIELAKNRKIKLILGTFIVNCIDELDPLTEGMLKMMGVFAELERNIISERVKSGIENAKAKGKTLGRPKTNWNNIPTLFFKYYPKYKNNEINKAELSKLCNISYPSVFKYLKILESKEKNYMEE